MSLVYSGLYCKTCKEEICSRHRHDYRVCQCGKTFIDGGLDYIRYGGEQNNVELRSLYLKDDIIKIREKVLVWSKTEQKTVLLKNISDEHLDSLINYYLSSRNDKMFLLYLKEKQYRNE